MTHSKTKKKIADAKRYAKMKASSVGYAHIKELRKKADGKRGPSIHRAKDRRDTRLWENHRIRRSDYDRMVVAQVYGCAICGADESAERHGVFCVDHNHKTGKIRALLCVKCNQGLGCFGDDPNRLRLALLYLKEHSSG
jgi:hypothetical protein